MSSSKALRNAASALFREGGPNLGPPRNRPGSGSTAQHREPHATLEIHTNRHATGLGEIGLRDLQNRGLGILGLHGMGLQLSWIR